VQGHPPAADPIDQLTSISEVQACALGAGHIQRLRVQGHLGGWVPEVGVPGHHGGLQNSDQICRPSGVSRSQSPAGFVRAWAHSDGFLLMELTIGCREAFACLRFPCCSLICFSLTLLDFVKLREGLRIYRLNDYEFLI